MAAQREPAQRLLILSHYSGSDVWVQRDEELFIRALGTHRQPGMHVTRDGHSRAALLKGYLLGLDRRRAWGFLNREECRRIAEEELLKCAPAEPQQ